MAAVIPPFNYFQMSQIEQSILKEQLLENPFGECLTPLEIAQEKRSQAASLRKKRLWRDILTGLRYHENHDVWFTTFTVPSKAVPIMDEFQLLIRLLRQKGHQVEYLAVHTTEGNGVVHVIHTGDRLDATVIREMWNYQAKDKYGITHDSSGKPLKNVQFDMKFFNKGDDKRLANYIVSHYLTNQKGYSRYSKSSGWLWPGATDEWHNLVTDYGYEVALDKWHFIVDHRRDDPAYRQKPIYQGLQWKEFDQEGLAPVCDNTCKWKDRCKGDEFCELTFPAREFWRQYRKTLQVMPDGL